MLLWIRELPLSLMVLASMTVLATPEVPVSTSSD